MLQIIPGLDFETCTVILLLVVGARAAVAVSSSLIAPRIVWAAVVISAWVAAWGGSVRERETVTTAQVVPPRFLAWVYTVPRALGLGGQRLLVETWKSNYTKMSQSCIDIVLKQNWIQMYIFENFPQKIANFFPFCSFPWSVRALH